LDIAVIIAYVERRFLFMKDDRITLKSVFVKDTIRETVAVWVTLAYLLFQLYRTFINPLVPLILRPIHVSSIGLLCFLYNPAKTEGKSKFYKYANIALDWFAFVSVPFHIWYAISQYDRLSIRINYLDPVLPIDIIACISLIILILFGIQRTIGKALSIFISIFIAYGWISRYLPGILYYKGMDIYKFTDLMIMGNDGIYGTATGASSGFIYWIMIFGALFGTCGGGQVLIDIGIRIGARSKDNSGPAKAAVVASGLMGMISGSAAANVAGTGVITIPMMKKAGYEPEEAGAIEAAASTGGQIMPPIMGTGAFLMAELLGVEYFEICKAAAIPAIIYYFAIFLLVHMLAKKRASFGYVPMEAKTEPILPRLYLLSPIAVLITMIVMGYTLQRSAIFAIASILILNIISPRMRYSPIHLIQQLLEATKLSSTVSQPISGCGIVIGIVSISGLATRLSGIIASFSGNLEWIGLAITMLGCLLLGMALPTVAAYLTAYVLFLPTLKSLGISTLAANLFIFYFGIFAQITPPVCVASYTAAGIAGAKPWDTGWKGMMYAACAFLVPYVFVYQPGILLQGTLFDIVSATSILLLGTTLMALGVAGYIVAPLNKWERVMLIIAGVLTCIPESYTDIIGIIIAAVVIVIHVTRHVSKRGKKSSVDTV